ncbi:MAG TPA: hypothetical protein DDZ80_04325 [Cyanobacteria bacterium UBA8803]|nr:hypothetical protein [Cyanobacteria bacterium UBA9273]HBL57784.1 hypothetical protein [Cyanobacteria bacterium UBA8803]
MKILEHTSTNLTLIDSTVGIWLGRLIGSIFLSLGCLGLFLLITSNSFPSLYSLIFLTVCLTVGIIFVFFLPKNTLWFDKKAGKLIFKSQKLLWTKVVEYPLSDITSVIVDKRRASDNTTYAVTLKIASRPQKLCLSSMVFMRLKKAEERANLICTFLNTPL